MLWAVSRVCPGGDKPHQWPWVTWLGQPRVLSLWLSLSPCCSPSLPLPSLQVPALGFLAGTGRARGFIRRWLKKGKKPTQQITQILAVPPLLLYSSEVPVSKRGTMFSYQRFENNFSN